MVVTTFDAAGTPTTSHEWVVELDAERAGFWTPDVAGWAERLALTDVVTVQAADRWGRALRVEPVFEGRMELVLEGPDLDRLRSLTRAKYGAGASLAAAVDWAWELDGPKSAEGGLIVHVVG